MTNFSGSEFGNKASGFDQPTQLPRDDEQRRAWQAINRQWWESTPMRYDWREDITHEPGTKSYFEEIDSRFLRSAREYMPWRELPFEEVIPFDELRSKDVLEIGVGHGTHAQLLAPRCGSFTGIDLTARAAQMTAKRLKLFNLPGRVLQMDAENVDFPDNSFDYVWSWGVIHHSADTRRVLQEINRVLRPAGRCTVMVYYRSWWQFYACGTLRGIFQKQFGRKGNLHHVTQAATDGAIARYYSETDWRRVVEGLFSVDAIKVYGQKNDLIPLPHGGLKSTVGRMLPDRLARRLADRLRMGSFLLAQMRKP